MEVEILNTTLIHPSPTPNQSPTTLTLSHLDTDPNLNVTFRTLRLFTPTTTDPAATISHALSKTLFFYHPLAATLHANARLELHPTATPAVPLTRATSSLTLAALLAHEPGSPLLDRLAPNPVQPDSLTHPLSLQVTRLACGGLALGMCVHHALCDGAGATQFLTAVAALARGAGLPVEPVWDRAVLLGPRSPPRVETPFHETLSFDGSSPYQNTQSTIPLVRECFHISNACMNQFRAHLESSSTGSKFTTFEALGAFIWAAKVKAGETKGTVKLVYSMNIKKIVDPPLPEGYWGNICVPVYVKLTVEKLLGQPMWETAKLIKESKKGVGDEYVRSYIDFHEVYYGKGITAGMGVTAFTDWRHLRHGEVDFGWGSPVAVWPLSWRLMGSLEPCFFLSYEGDDVKRKDGFRVLVSLPGDAMERFRLEMEMFGGDNEDILGDMVINKL